MTTNAALLREARLQADAPATTSTGRTVFIARARTLLPQLADALEAAVIAVESEGQFYKAAVADLAEAEARLAKVWEAPIEVYGMADAKGFRARCPFCETVTYQERDDERGAIPLSEMAHPDNCPARPMEPGT